jgi:DNA-binding HxlR family transcriptional regulator
VNTRKPSRYFCPVEVALSRLTGKWKPLIIFHLKDAPQKFSILQAQMPQISHKVLTQQLRALQTDQIVVRKRLPNAHVAYELTELGHSLEPALTALADWGLEHYPELGVELIWRSL